MTIVVKCLKTFVDLMVIIRNKKIYEKILVHGFNGERRLGFPILVVNGVC